MCAANLPKQSCFVTSPANLPGSGRCVTSRSLANFLRAVSMLDQIVYPVPPAFYVDRRGFKYPVVPWMDMTAAYIRHARTHLVNVLPRNSEGKIIVIANYPDIEPEKTECTSPSDFVMQ